MRDHLSVYRRLFAYLRPYPRRVLLAYGGMLFATLLNLFVPQVIKQAIDQGLASGTAWALVGGGAIILAIAVVRGVAAFISMYSGEWLSFRVAYDLRNDFFYALETLPFSFHDQAHTGDLMSRATGDISETERFAGAGLMQLVSVVLLAVGVVIAMFLMDAKLALITLGPILALVFVALRLGRVVEPMWKSIQEQMGVLSTAMQESLTGIHVVKAFAREQHEFARFELENERWFERRSQVIRTWGNHWPLFTFILSIGIFLLLWFGGPWAMEGEITVGTLFAMIAYLLMLNGPVQQLGNLVNLAATAGASGVASSPSPTRPTPSKTRLLRLISIMCRVSSPSTMSRLPIRTTTMCSRM